MLLYSVFTPYAPLQRTHPREARSPGYRPSQWTGPARPGTGRACRARSDTRRNCGVGVFLLGIAGAAGWVSIRGLVPGRAGTTRDASGIDSLAGGEGKTLAA